MALLGRLFGGIRMNMFNQLKDKKGFTLVEVIIAMAILGIITISIITVFSSSFSNIFSMGNRSKAIAVASQKLEVLYTIPISMRDSTTIKNTLLDDETIFVEGDETLLYQQSDKNLTRFKIQPKKLMDYNGEKIGYEITIVVFYQNGQRHVTLNTFIRGGD